MKEAFVWFCPFSCAPVPNRYWDHVEQPSPLQIMHLPVASPPDKTHACIEKVVLSLKASSFALSPLSVGIVSHSSSPLSCIPLPNLPSTHFGAPLPNSAWLSFPEVSLAISPLPSSKSQTPAMLSSFSYAYPAVAINSRTVTIAIHFAKSCCMITSLNN